MTTKKLQIRTDGDPILRKNAKQVSVDDIRKKDFQKFCSDLAFCMLDNNGIGIAAPQVGESIQLVIINTKDGALTMINPVIVKHSLIKEWGEEGCLSVPNTFGDVKRFKKINCHYLDNNGVKAHIEASGLMARVIQHEIDHLNGQLFIDSAKKIRIINPVVSDSD